MTIRFTLDESLTGPELAAIVSTLAADSARLRGMIARNDALRDLAQHRLIGLQIADAEIPQQVAALVATGQG